MTGDGPHDSPGAVHPAGRTVTCPACGYQFVTDPPPEAPCPDCGYDDW